MSAMRQSLRVCTCACTQTVQWAPLGWLCAPEVAVWHVCTFMYDHDHVCLHTICTYAYGTYMQPEALRTAHGHREPWAMPRSSTPLQD